MQKRFYVLEVATRTRRPFSGRGCHALTWRSHDHSLAAYLSRHLRQTVLLPGNSTVWQALTVAINCLSSGINIVAGGRPLPPEILPPSDLPSPVNGIL